MKTNNLILLGGGFIAGYVLCKLMNRNSENENFSANGENKDTTQYKYSGKGQILFSRNNGTFYKKEQVVSSYPLNNISSPNTNQPFILTGDSKKITLNGNTTHVSPSGTEYVKSNIFMTIVGAGGMPWRNYFAWFPKESVVRI